MSLRNFISYWFLFGAIVNWFIAFILLIGMDLFPVAVNGEQMLEFGQGRFIGGLLMAGIGLFNYMIYRLLHESKKFIPPAIYRGY